MIRNSNNMPSYAIRREGRLALKKRSLTAEKERSWFEPTINPFRHLKSYNNNKEIILWLCVDDCRRE